MKDLALLVADKNMDFAMRGILNRARALGMRAVSYEIRQHVGRDGGVAGRSARDATSVSASASASPKARRASATRCWRALRCVRLQLNMVALASMSSLRSGEGCA